MEAFTTTTEFPGMYDNPAAIGRVWEPPSVTVGVIELVVALRYLSPTPVGPVFPVIPVEPRIPVGPVPPPPAPKPWPFKSTAVPVPSMS